MATSWTNTLSKGSNINKVDIVELKTALVNELIRRSITNTMSAAIPNKITTTFISEITSTINSFSTFVDIVNAGDIVYPSPITILRNKINSLEGTLSCNVISDCNAACSGLCTGNCSGTVICHSNCHSNHSDCHSNYVNCFSHANCNCDSCNTHGNCNCDGCHSNCHSNCN